MLQDIRKNVQGPFVKVIVWLIAISFAAFGIESILLGGSSNSVAEVNGEELNPIDLQQTMNAQRRQLIAMMGEQLDPALLEDERLQGAAMESLISRTLLRQSADEMDLVASEQLVGRMIADMEQFQIDGRFSPEMYKNILSSAGYTPASFKQTLVEDLVSFQLRSSLAGAEFVTPSELELNAEVFTEQRDIRYLRIPRDQFQGSTEFTPEEVKRYYAANEERFMSEESVELDYIEIDAAQFREPVEEAVLLEEYEIETSSYQYATESRVSHILFERGDNESEEALKIRVAGAEEALAGGRNFADLAAEVSDDVGSAAAGGDLGFTSGDAFPEEMETVIAELSLNEVSAPVTTDAGVHLIVLTERREGEVPSLDELRMDLTDRIQLRLAAEEVLRVAEQLKDLSFNAEDLAGPAQELGLEVKRSEPVTREHSSGLFAQDALRAAAFSDDVLFAGHNSDVIELGANRYVVLRVRVHNDSELRSLDEVRDQVLVSLGELAADRALAEAAESSLLALREGSSVEALAQEQGYEWQVELGADRRSRTLPQALQQRAFQLSAPVEGESSFDYVEDPTGDIYVFELARVMAGKPDLLNAAQRSGLRQQLVSEYASLLLEQYQRGLRANAEIVKY